jgi:hypothetical protein
MSVNMLLIGSSSHTYIYTGSRQSLGDLIQNSSQGQQLTRWFDTYLSSSRLDNQAYLG